MITSQRLRASTWLCCAAILCGAVGQAHGSGPVKDLANNPGSSKFESPPSDRIAGVSTIINFDTYPDNTAVPNGAEITNQYAALGVTFSSAACAPNATNETTVIGFLGVPSAPNCLAPCGPAPNNGATLIVHFSSPVVQISGSFVDDGIAVSVTAFDASNNPVDTAQSDGSASGIDQFSVAHGAGIMRLELVGGFFAPSFPDGWGLDDLMFPPDIPIAVQPVSWSAAKILFR